jgi:hypothetical protein
MVLLLAAVAAVELIVGEKREALVLLAAILPIAGMDVFLEWKSESALEALRKLTVRRARVRRDGELATLPRRARAGRLDPPQGRRPLSRPTPGSWIPPTSRLTNLP